MADFHHRMMNIQGRPPSLIVGDVSAWHEGHRYTRHAAAEIALEADREIERLRGIITEAIPFIGYQADVRDILERAVKAVDDSKEQS